MPVPQGMVEVKYVHSGDGVEATVNLPEGVSGDLVWKGERISLHGGENVEKLN